MRASAGHLAYCRVSVLAPRGRVDVALPADVPLAELVPMLLELLGEPGPQQRPAPWRFTGATGGVLPAAATLDELGVLDGELLRIGPDAPPPPVPIFDDPVDALAADAGGGPSGHEDRRFRAGAVLVLALAAAGCLAAVRGLPPDPGVPGSLVAIAVALAALGAVAALARAAQLARDPAAVDELPGSPAPHLLAAHTAAVTAVALAAAAGWAALPGPPHAAHLLLAAAAAGTTAAVAQAVVRVVAPVLVAAVVAAVLLGVGALLRLRFGMAPGAIAAGAGALVLAVGPVLPRAALRLAGVPRPVVPADAQELVAADHGPDLLPPAELAERADLARGYLAGLVGGGAVVAAAAVVPAAATGSWPGPTFAAVTVVVLGLRSRGFTDRAPARTLLAAAVAGALGLAALVALHGGPVVRLLGALALMLAVAAGSVVAARPAPIASPVSRRAVDLLEGLLVAAAVPLALGAMGAYALVRGL
jgi:type VII secretion integral membrane protein EccD